MDHYLIVVRIKGRRKKITLRAFTKREGDNEREGEKEERERRRKKEERKRKEREREKGIIKRILN